MAKDKPWEERWKIIDPLPGGGQCYNYKVVEKNNGDKVFVLKVIKEESKQERRARFYREVHNYIGMSSPFFPKIVDHNCNESPDVKRKLYLVYPYIEGTSLEDFI